MSKRPIPQSRPAAGADAATVAFELQVDIGEDADAGFVAHVRGLDLYTQGPTESEALDNAREAARLFVESCAERGVLPQLLTELGFELVAKPATESRALASGPGDARVPAAREMRVPIPIPMAVHA